MKAKDIKHLFPITIKITKEHRELAEAQGGLHKLGTLLLKEIIPEELHEKLSWGLSIGNIEDVLLETEHEIIHEGKKVFTPLYLDKNFLGNEVTFKIRKK